MIKLTGAHKSMKTRQMMFESLESGASGLMRYKFGKNWNQLTVEIIKIVPTVSEYLSETKDEGARIVMLDSAGSMWEVTYKRVES